MLSLLLSLLKSFCLLSLQLFFFCSCEVSQKFVPKFERLAEQFNNRNGLKFGTVDCTENSDLCIGDTKSLDIILYKKEEGKAKFRGVRNVDGVTKFLIKHLGEDILVNSEKKEKLST